jgi:hypothetical protein
MMLRMTAIASLAVASAGCAFPRVQSHLSQRCASFGSRCPQYGQAILSSILGSGRAAGASVYSTFIEIVSFQNPKGHGIRQAKRTGRGWPDSIGTDQRSTRDGLPSGRLRIIGFQIASDLLCSLNPRLFYGFATVCGAGLLTSSCALTF